MSSYPDDIDDKYGHEYVHFKQYLKLNEKNDLGIQNMCHGLRQQKLVGTFQNIEIVLRFFKITSVTNSFLE